MPVVEIRCEKFKRRLFAKLLMEEKPVIVEGNLLEFACRDCAKEQGAKKVLHRYNPIGELVETEVLH
jgi:hypothetical protein